ncbi:MAG: ATP-binding protein [Bacteroidota bacterium]
MLVEFRVSNYRSIAREQVLSLVPSTAQSDYPDNILRRDKFAGLNVVALYGPNNSGKSNLLRSIQMLSRLVVLSSASNSTENLPYDPNLLVQGFAQQPTSFEVTFITNGNRYRYGLQYDRQQVQSEWLFRKRVGREVELFYREGETIQVSSGFKGRARLIDTAVSATRANGLFLSSCDMLNVEEAKVIFAWFKTLINHDTVTNAQVGSVNTLRLLASSAEMKAKIVEHLKRLDLGFIDIVVLKRKFDPATLPDSLDQNMRESLVNQLSDKTGLQPNTVRQVYTEKGEQSEEQIMWPLYERESAGTQSAFSLSGPVVYALMNGGTLIVDEIEAKLHTDITTKIVKLFLSKKTNPKHAQLIFATHDTNLLKRVPLRRDQINFIDLGKAKSTELYTLSDFRYFSGNKERPDTDKEKRYLEGRYGAVPTIKSFADLFQAK